MALISLNPKQVDVFEDLLRFHPKPMSVGRYHKSFIVYGIVRKVEHTYKGAKYALTQLGYWYAKERLKTILLPDFPEPINDLSYDQLPEDHICPVCAMDAGGVWKESTGNRTANIQLDTCPVCGVHCHLCPIDWWLFSQDR